MCVKGDEKEKGEGAHTQDDKMEDEAEQLQTSIETSEHASVSEGIRSPKGASMKDAEDVNQSHAKGGSSSSGSQDAADSIQRQNEVFDETKGHEEKDDHTPSTQEDHTCITTPEDPVWSPDCSPCREPSSPSLPASPVLIPAVSTKKQEEDDQKESWGNAKKEEEVDEGTTKPAVERGNDSRSRQYQQEVQELKLSLIHISEPTRPY